jgi:hypothetical protein
MSNAFNDFLSNVGSGLAGTTDAQMKDYQHARHLYVDNTYARAPKFGHLYFVTFNYNDNVIRDPKWANLGSKDVGLLVRQVSLPKFKIATEVMNQYNRKTVVQTKLNYEAVSMEFHDDNSEITNGLWKNYYKYYFTDSTYGGADDSVVIPAQKSSIMKQLFGGLNTGLTRRKQKGGQIGNTSTPRAYKDTKYSDQSYPYGLNNLQDQPFFKSIDIYILHQQKFTQITLVNPMITEWAHDDVSQSGETKPLRNRMSVIYEDVFYNQGTVGKNTDSGLFAAVYYDNSASPLSISGKGSASIFGQGGLIGGVADIFGENGSVAQGNYLAAALQSATLIKNAGQITKESLTNAGYSLLGTSVGILASSGNQPGSAVDRLSSGLSQSGLGIYTNQYATSNLEAAEAKPVQIVANKPRELSELQKAYSSDGTVPGGWVDRYGRPIRTSNGLQVASGSSPGVSIPKKGGQ